MDIRQATSADIDEVAALYSALIKDMNERHTNYPAWADGVYPTRQTAEAALAEGSLFVGVHKGKIVSSCVLNRQQAPQYAQGAWKAKGGIDAALTIHTFCVHPAYHRRGFGRQTLAFAEEHGRAIGCTGLRLDTAVQNEVGAHMYEAAGFEVVGVVDLQTGRPGLTFHRLYEKVL